jgi:hypothetical protein
MNVIKIDYSQFGDRSQVREIVDMDRSLPEPLRQMVRDDRSWEESAPSGNEINRLRDFFGPLNLTTAAMYRQALVVLREFERAEAR